MVASIRTRQCILSFYATTDPTHRYLHFLNTMKYVSGILVIIIGAFPRIGMTQKFDAEGILFLICALFNSIYSFFWDITMDWGLLQPYLPRRLYGLRRRLLYSPCLYYFAIGLDLILRILWVTKWLERWSGLGAEFKFVAELSEVVRRIMWNAIRIEWESIKVAAELENKASLKH